MVRKLIYERVSKYEKKGKQLDGDAIDEYLKMREGVKLPSKAKMNHDTNWQSMRNAQKYPLTPKECYTNKNKDKS